MLFVLARLYFFDAALAKTIGNQEIETYDYVRLFAKYLRSLTAGPIGVRRDGDNAEVFYGDTGFHLAGSDQGVRTTLHTYDNAQWPSCEEVPAGSPLDPDVHENIRELMASHTFASGISFPISVF
jgi:hypothetical protein